MRIKNKGFTLIELMVTVAIIGILGAVAVPAYQDYTVRAQVAEALSLASGAKVNFLEAYSQTGELPISNEEAGYQSQSGKHVDNVTIGYTNDMSVAIKAQFNNSPETNKILHGETVMLVIREDKVGNSGVLSWLCYSSLESKYLPSGCNLWEG